VAEGTEHADRSEAATPRRLQKARAEGNVPISRELPAFAGLAAATLALMITLPPAAHDAALQLRAFLAGGYAWDLSDGGAGALRLAALVVLRLAAPFVLATLLAGAGSVLLQSGFLLNPAALRPDLRRINPLAGLRRLASPESLVELGKSLAKVAVLGTAVWHAVEGSVKQLAAAPLWDLQTLLGRTLGEVVRVLAAVLAVQAVIVALDLFWVRLRHARALRMSREDLRQEQRETDGDPRVKGRLKQIRLQRGRKRMLAAVPKATVVLTNPTHYAVALVYDRARNAAPRVVAKGVDEMAARIRALAQESKVPLVANPPLARALYRVELDTEIPAEHYQAVAEIIAYVWRLRQRVREAAH
jgi:flagellar biosynthesis protein FlhB